jgi:endonuclease YncB( thermonuclease family)
MRRLPLSALAVFVLVAAGLSGAASSTRVLLVSDGDTLSVASGERVRLLQIDTPELGSGECYSRQARSALLRLAPPGSAIRLEADPALDAVDRYGRLLRYVWRGSLNVNLELVRQGAATPYFYRGERGKYASALLAAARQAKASRRGLWGACPGTRLDPYAPAATGQSGPPAKAGTRPSGTCDPNYAGGCVPPYPPDVDCADLRARGIGPVRVIGADVHRLDADGDGWGCE